MKKKQKKTLIRIIFTFIFLFILHFIYLNPILEFLLYMIIYLIISYDILIKAIKGIINGQIFDENFLMALATLGAVGIAIFNKRNGIENGFLLYSNHTFSITYYSSDYTEAIAVMLFFQIGELFQSLAISKSRKNIKALMDIRPDYANIEKNQKIEKVSPDSVHIGTTIIVKPGEKIPIDGIIIDGKGSLNTSNLTGESLPKEVNIGDKVISGCINLNSVLKIKTEKEFGESTVSKILDLVDNASTRKAKSENFISKFARIYTPIVCLFALILAFVPPLFNIIVLHMDANFSNSIYRALTILIISCPCALVVSIPLSFFSGIGGASKQGILIKGSNYIESITKIKNIVFDKTGTLTKGVFEVNGIHHNKLENEKILEYAAYAESNSTHPISISLQKAYGKEINIKEVKNINEISGEGIVANIKNEEVIVGNEKIMKRFNIQYIECHHIGTIVHVAINNEYAGHILISDILKPTSKEAIQQLKNLNIKKIIMLTGDKENVAKNVSSSLGIEEYYSNLLPQDKVSKVDELLKNKNRNETLAFVGDGINDAPVITLSDIGISMGAIGSDAAIESADVVIMDDDPLKIPKAINISKKCMNIVYENIFFALSIKIISIILGAFGIVNMWIAIFADVGVTIIAILNAIRALYNK
ncbi:MAG: heavy metal translocating P-type ATPase [Eubacteriales bacterium]|nr:heavy metal translocating P-type ATPase [Eubacteriales bacterium]